MHPTMKPVPLIGRLMNNSSRPGWMVGDFFAGSGSTLMAAEQLGRTAFCMELDEKNCDVIIKRWETYTGQKRQRSSNRRMTDHELQLAISGGALFER